MHFQYVCSLLVSAAVSVTASAQSLPGMDMQHHHHDDASAEKLGEVHFPVSCKAGVKAPFERGIALLHSFGYTEAEDQFRTIAADDPACAMAHWGIAMSQYHELWGRPDEAAAKTGAEQMAKARELAAKSPVPTARELAYIHALDGFYTTLPQGFQKAADNYVASMATLHAAYPADIEGSAFYALALIAAVAPNDTSLTNERKALGILIPLFKAHPEHPGLAHYIIHTCDTPALAQDGLEAAKIYASIAPSSAHATHMPGHIFARLGMWQEDIDSNLASVAASEKSEAAHEPGAAHQMHADEFLIYAWLQVGEDEKARALTAKIASIGDRMAAMSGMDDMKNSGHSFDNELRVIYPLEMRDWKQLAAVQSAAGSKYSDEFEVWWGQGIAAGHLHDAPLATTALAAYDKDLDEMKNGPYADAMEGMQIRRNIILGWKAFAEDHPDAALEAMRKAADQQDKLGQGEVDIPAREMLADLLMLLHRPKEALLEYKVALKLSPNRLNGLLSAGAACEALGNIPDASAYYAQASHNTDGGKDTIRVQHAKEYLAKYSALGTH